MIHHLEHRVYRMSGMPWLTMVNQLTKGPRARARERDLLSEDRKIREEATRRDRMDKIVIAIEKSTQTAKTLVVLFKLSETNIRGYLRLLLDEKRIILKRGVCNSAHYYPISAGPQ